MPDILVVGDIITDVAVQLRELGMSAEGIVSHEEVSRAQTDGGAANVARHCERLGADVRMLGPFSATKTRFYVDGCKVLKVNRTSDDAGLSHPQLLRVIRESPCKSVVVCDMGYGSFSGIEQDIVSHCRDARKRLYVDCQLSQTRPSFERWVGADEIFLNETEHAAVSDDILSQFGAFHVKRGPKGSDRLSASTELGRYNLLTHSGFVVDAVDTVGAGDAYLAAWAVFGDLSLANKWAALSCKRIGTELPELKELDDEIATR